MGLAIGDYRVARVLAEGATTRTVEVEIAATSVPFAVARLAIGKRLQPRVMRDAEARRQLETEAAILVALGGRGAPRLLDRGADDAGPWLVIERLATPTLALHASALGHPRERAAFVDRVASPLFRALHAVHTASDDRGPLSVVHADVSPANVLVSSQDGSEIVHAALLDFGLAHFRDAPPVPGSSLRGTPRFLAPEVARGEPATVQSDLFSLGLSLLHVAAGGPARVATQLANLILEAAEEPVADYAERATDALAPDVRAMLRAVTAFDPSARPRSAREACRHGSW